MKGDIIKVIGDKQISWLVFCDRIRKLDRSNFKEGQTKLNLSKNLEKITFKHEFLQGNKR